MKGGQFTTNTTKLLLPQFQYNSIAHMLLPFLILGLALLSASLVRASSLTQAYSFQSLPISGLVLGRVFESTLFHRNNADMSWARQCPTESAVPEGGQPSGASPETANKSGNMRCLTRPIKTGPKKSGGQGGGEPWTLICEHCKTKSAEPGTRHCPSCAARQSSQSATEEFPCSVCSQVGGGRLEHGSWICRACDRGTEATCSVCWEPASTNDGPLLRSGCKHRELAHRGCLNNDVLRCRMCDRDVHFIDSQGRLVQSARCVPQEQTVQTLISGFTMEEFLRYCDWIRQQLQNLFGVAVPQHSLANFIAANQQIPASQVVFQTAQHFLPPGIAEAIVQHYQQHQHQQHQQIPLQPLPSPPVQPRRQRHRCSIM